MASVNRIADLPVRNALPLTFCIPLCISRANRPSRHAMIANIVFAAKLCRYIDPKE
jgi:hypothetical protein